VAVWNGCDRTSVLAQNPEVPMRQDLRCDRPAPALGMDLSTFTLNNNPIDLRFRYFAIVFIYLKTVHKIVKNQINQSLK
jgi:hypothetical protein